MLNIEGKHRRKGNTEVRQHSRFATQNINRLHKTVVKDIVLLPARACTDRCVRDSSLSGCCHCMSNRTVSDHMPVLTSCTCEKTALLYKLSWSVYQYTGRYKMKLIFKGLGHPTRRHTFLSVAPSYVDGFYLICKSLEISATMQWK